MEMKSIMELGGASSGSRTTLARTLAKEAVRACGVAIATNNFLCVSDTGFSDGQNDAE